MALSSAPPSRAPLRRLPGCQGRVLPPLQIQSIIEYTHRFIALITTR